MDYCKIYNQIIANARERAVSGYTEEHHVVPRSLGGTDSLDNLVRLTAREHFVCHWLLVKMYTGNARKKMIYALHMMKTVNKYQNRYTSAITSKVYARLKQEYAEIVRDNFLGRRYPGELNGMFNKKHSEESKRLMSVNSKGKTSGELNGMFNKKHSEESKKKMSESKKGKSPWNKGKSRTDDDRAKMKEGWAARKAAGLATPHNKGKKVNSTKKLRCQHCNGLFSIGPFVRWHGDKCKNNNETSS